MIFPYSRRMEGYHFTFKGGLFHAYPEDVGGPFKFLGDGMNAMRFHYDREQKKHEGSRRLILMM